MVLSLFFGHFAVIGRDLIPRIQNDWVWNIVPESVT
jgi:hypothetical protein